MKICTVRYTDMSQGLIAAYIVFNCVQICYENALHNVVPLQCGVGNVFREILSSTR